MKVLLDVNIVLDYFLERQPFFEASSEIFALLAAKKFAAFVSATTPPYIYYFARKQSNNEQARTMVRTLLQSV